MIQIDYTNDDTDDDDDAWLWVVIVAQPIHYNRILGVSIYFKVQEEYASCRIQSFLKSLVKLYGKHIVYSDGGRTWYCIQKLANR